jgi:hypothetical protein
VRYLKEPAHRPEGRGRAVAKKSCRKREFCDIVDDLLSAWKKKVNRPCEFFIFNETGLLQGALGPRPSEALSEIKCSYTRLLAVYSAGSGGCRQGPIPPPSRKNLADLGQKGGQASNSFSQELLSRIYLSPEALAKLFPNGLRRLDGQNNLLK